MSPASTLVTGAVASSAAPAQAVLTGLVASSAAPAQAVLTGLNSAVTLAPPSPGASTPTSSVLKALTGGTAKKLKRG